MSGRGTSVEPGLDTRWFVFFWTVGGVGVAVAPVTWLTMIMVAVMSLQGCPENLRMCSCGMGV